MAEDKVTSHFQGYTVPVPGYPAEATFQVNIHGARFTVHVSDKRDFDEKKAVRSILQAALLTEKKELASHLQSYPKTLQGVRAAWHVWSKSLEFRESLKGHCEPEILLEEMT